jgi:hypothetical protein
LGHGLLTYGETFASCTKRITIVEDHGGPAIASAVCIAPQWALTAAHVVETAAFVQVDGHRASLVFIHPYYARGTPSSGCDIAMVKIVGDFGEPHYPPLSDGGESPGDVVAIAGFGVTGKLSTGYAKVMVDGQPRSVSDGKLRAGTNRVDRLEGTILVCEAQRGGSPLPFCIAPGDSGGPAFSGSGADSRLVGINSITRADKGPLSSKVGEEMGATRVSLFRDWIAAVQAMAP